MKKKLALLLAAVMVAAMVPMSVFAATDNHVDKVAVVEKEDVLGDNAPTLVIKNKHSDLKPDDTFYLTLNGAEFKDEFFENSTANVKKAEVTKITDTEISLKFKSSVTGTPSSAEEIRVTFSGVEVTGDEATVTVESNGSGVTDGTYVFAATEVAKVTAEIDKPVAIPKDGEAEIGNIIIKETLAGALKEDEVIKVKLEGDFEFDFESDISFAGTGYTAVYTPEIGDDFSSKIDIEKELLFGVYTTPGTPEATTAKKIVVSGIKIKADKDAEVGDTAEIVISGAGIEKTVLEVGTVVADGVTFTVENKKLPVFYSGRAYEDSDETTLKVTLKEATPDSWQTTRKTTFTFPKGVQVISANRKTSKSIVAPGNVDYDENVVTLTGVKIKPDEKAEYVMDFNLSISPEFTGDITCTLGGSSVDEDISVVVAEARSPITIEAVSSDVTIDYRYVPIGDIIIKEDFAGALEKGTTLALSLDSIEIEDGFELEVEGDIELDVKSNKGVLRIEVEKESYKTPATIRITNVEAFLQRSLPVGSYALDLVLSGENDAYFQNYNANGSKAGQKYFDIKEIEVDESYVEIITAGRDKDDASFTTKVVVPVGEKYIVVGGQQREIDAAAYTINGYTMLPVRAVTGALSGDNAAVRWDDATKTVTIASGKRIIGMTIGSNVMNVNGVEIPMNAAPEITNDRTFLPLRDLGYALGLSDSDIGWDEASSTATLN